MIKNLEPKKTSVFQPSKFEIPQETEYDCMGKRYTFDLDHPECVHTNVCEHT